jgi:hypothetical protein
MSKIYTHEQTAKIFAAMQAIELANNGYAFLGHIIGKDTDLAQALTDAGYTVRMEYKGFTARAAQFILAHCAMPAIARAPSCNLTPAFDYEGAILARQESRMLDY